MSDIKLLGRLPLPRCTTHGHR